jgi:hypothetical protein
MKRQFAAAHESGSDRMKRRDFECRLGDPAAFRVLVWYR